MQIDKYCACMCIWQLLEAMLPPRQSYEMPQGEHVEEVNMIEFDSSVNGAGGRRGEAYDEDNDDEDEPGVRRVQCAHQ